MSQTPLRRQRDEHGAVALMVGVMAVLLVGMAALVVDLSHGFVQKHAIQKRADFAALAGSIGDDLPVTAAGAGCAYGTAGRATDQAIIDAAAYLDAQAGVSDGEPLDDVSPGQLVDCDLNNGEAGFGTFARDITCVQNVCLRPDPNQLTVISPPDHVDFGLAAVFSVSGVDVRGEATVEIKTPLQQTLPLYAHDGCDYGQQTISQPTNGHSSTGVNLAEPGSNGYLKEDSLVVSPASSTTPPTVQLNSTTSTVTITGMNLHKVKKVGLFRSSDVSPPPPVVVLPTSATNVNGFTFNAAGTTLTFTVPLTVTSVQDVWFIRLWGPNSNGGGATDEWTPVTNPGNSNTQTNLAALPITVGNATLSCGQGSSEGNFGTLDLYNESANAPSGQDANIAYNIAYGLQYGLAAYPEDYWTADYKCVDGQDGVAKTWELGQDNDGVNCVSTKTGLASNPAEMGFVTGVAPEGKAVLKDPEAEELCSADVPTGTTHLATAPTGQTISNDVLSCYFTNDTVTVGDVSSELYSGDPVIDQSIYQSARFVNVPVLGAQPAEGSSDHFQIIGFRPGFITDQAATATRVSGTTPTAGNGLTWSSNNTLQAVSIVFLNPAALPNPPLDPNGNYIPYVGNGPKQPLLVD